MTSARGHGGLGLGKAKLCFMLTIITAKTCGNYEGSMKLEKKCDSYQILEIHISAPVLLPSNAYNKIVVAGKLRKIPPPP